MTTKLTIEYDGSGFAGWARQPDERTVQEELEHALQTVLGATGTDGRPLVKDRTSPPDDEAAIDCYLRPYDRNTGVEEAMHAYLSWEIDLVNEITRDGTVQFGALGAHTDEPAHAA